MFLLALVWGQPGEMTSRGRAWRGCEAVQGEELGPGCDLGEGHTGNASLEPGEEAPPWDFPGRNCWAGVPGIQEFPKQTQAPTW